MNQAERMCDRIVLINRARKVIDGTINEVRSRFATRIVSLDAEGGLDGLARLDGVVAAQVTAGHARLELAGGVDPHTILRHAMQDARILRFEIQRPDLQEIFVKLVGQDGQATPAEAGAEGPVEHAHG
jgi:ABC-2 type transport system ATP-binding protein